MDRFLMEFDDPIFSAIHQLMDVTDDFDKSSNAPTRAYVRDRKAMRNTPADVKELPNSLVFTVDMPGVKHDDIKVQVEDGDLLVISGERRRSSDDERDKEGKYLRMERRMGKFMRSFPLPDNADTEAISATYKDGVLTVTVEKKPPPETKTPRTVEVKVA